MHTQLSRFATHAATLVKNGWRPIPGYLETKRPSINGWDTYNSRQWEDDELQSMIAGRGQQEGEIICLAVQKEIVAIDLDIEDEHQMELVKTLAQLHLGQTPMVRIGRHPRVLLIYRNDGSVRSKKLHPIEIFAGSGQIVGFGYHAKAQRDYQWPLRSPLDTPSDSPDIPIIGSHQISRFLTLCWTVLPKRETPTCDLIEPNFIGKDHEQDRNHALAIIHEATDALQSANEGNRNNLLFHAAYIAGQAIGAGLVERQEAEFLLTHAADACGLSEDDGRRAVQATMRSGITQGTNNPFFIAAAWFEPIHSEPDPEQPTGDMTGLNFDDNKPFTYPPSLIKNLLPKRGIAFIGGQSGAGKTFLAIDLATSLATRQPFFGRRIKEQVGVLIIAGEGAETIQPRIHVARLARNIDTPLPISWMSKIPDFNRSEDVRAFVSKCREVNQIFLDRFKVRLGVVIIDTLAAVFNLEDESDNSEAAKVIKIMNTMSEALGVLVMPIHHYGKGAETGLRGASAWRAGADAVLSITADRNQLTGIVSDHQLWLSKSRVGEEGSVGEFALRTLMLGVDEDGDDLASCYVAPSATPQMSAVQKRESEVVVLEMIEQGEWRADPRSEQWVGVAFAEAFHLDAKVKGQVAQIKALVRRYMDEKKIKEVTRHDQNRRPRRYVVVENKDNMSEKEAAPVAPVDVRLEHELEQSNLFD